MDARAHERGRQVRARLLIAALAVAAISTSTAAASPLTGRVLVSLRKAQSRRAGIAGATAFEARTGARPDGPVVPEIGLVTVAPPAGQRLATFVRRLRAAAGVRAVALERRFTLRFLPNDPALTVPESATGTPPGTPVEWWPMRENLPAAWDITRGDGATVALIDTGVDGSHPEIAGKIAATANFDANSSDGPPTTDPVGHGTHVASLACGASGNGVGLAGAGLDCNLIVEKSDLSDASVAQAIVDATNRGADAINMSFGTDGSTPAPPAVIDAINYAFSHNVVMAAAAADSAVSEQGDPANVLQPAGTGADLTQGRGLTVTAADFSDQRASFAGYGTEISLAAYGTFEQSAGPPGIFGAFPHNHTSLDGNPLLPQLQQPCQCRTTFQGDNGYAYLQGTSMATPMVTAVGALMRHLNPTLSAGEIITIIKQTARRPAGTGWSQDLGWGILDGGAAVDAARHVDHMTPQAQLLAIPRRTRHGTLRLRWTGSDPAPAGVIAPGIDHYEIWRAYDGRGPQLLATTTATSLVVHLHAGHHYGFFVRAVDRAGQHQPAPTAYPRVAALRRRGR